LRQGRWRDLPLSSPTLKIDNPRLHLLRPTFTLPGSKHSDWIARLNGLKIARQVRQWTHARQWSDYHCWCRIPLSLFTLDSLQPKSVTYDVTDNYQLYETQVRCRRLVRQRERKMFRRADLILISSKELQHSYRLRASNTVRVPNGVQYNLFAKASQPGELHPLVANMKKPVIGYVGLTSRWMDFHLLEMLGRRWPRQILMVGPIAAEVEKEARSIPGVIWGGFVPHQDLAPLLRGFDVCIMPHIVNNLRRMSNPLKIWEYMATGKPFVSVDLPALSPIRHLVGIAQNPAHFVELVHEQLTNQNPEAIQARQQVAKDYSWDSMFHLMMTHLHPYLR
jgi:glycosyltransferase involved in cell wall biosynthesis